MKKTFLPTTALVFTALFLFSCQKDISPKQKVEELQLAGKANNDKQTYKTKTFYGPAVPLGQGVGRAWITVNAERVPISLGVNLSAKALLNQGSEGVEYVFQLPKQVAIPPYDHIDLGWNPVGHEPDGVYSVPHFDLHFYMISSAQQATIPFLAPPAFDVQLPPQYTPPAYFQTPGLVPNMGAHIIDLQAPEFTGGTFTKTFIYGSYAGKLTFLEPMFTVKYLASLIGATAVPTPIRQPQAFQRAGYYPASYTISYDSSPEKFTFSLDNLMYHPAQ